MKPSLIVAGLLLLWSPIASADEPPAPAPAEEAESPDSDDDEDDAASESDEDLGEAPEAEKLHLDVEIGTDLAIQIGGTVNLTLPQQVRISTTLGILPRPYVNLINEIITGFGWYDDLTAALIEDTLSESLIWRLHAGYIFDFGLYIDGGYSLVTLGGGTSAEAVMSILTGEEPEVPGPERIYDVESTLHMLDIEIGWKGVFGDFVLRCALGFSGTVASSTTVEQTFNVNNKALQRGIDELERFTEAYLDDVYTSYVFTPVVSVSLGYRFF